MERDCPSHDTVSRRNEFIEHLRDHKHQLFNFIFCILQNMSDTEDVFQQTSLALWESYDSFTPGTSFGAWAMQVARHRVHRFIRSKQRNRHCYFTDELIDQLANSPFAANDVQEARLQALAKCREKLSRTDQQLVELCYGGANTILEAAKQIGRPVETVYCSLTRIRSRLRECIERNLARERQI